jgi:CHAT domain-containing protein/Tfp pilus assembly protein PilF
MTNKPNLSRQSVMVSRAWTGLLCSILVLTTESITFFARANTVPAINTSFAQFLNLDDKNIDKAEEESASLYDQGRYSDSAALLERIVSWKEKHLGPESQETVRSLNNLAILYNLLGLHGKASVVHERALETREKILGIYNVYTANSLSNLASDYRDQGLSKKAETFDLRALAIREKILGTKHQDTADSLNNLALDYLDQGLYEKAELHLDSALSIRKELLGPDHSDVAQSYVNLALLYQAQGFLSKAESLLIIALEIDKKSFGPNHPHISGDLTDLANLYAAKGMLGKTLPLLEQALAIREKAFGKFHPDVAKSFANLGHYFTLLNQYEKALSLNQMALEVLERTLGPKHPDTAKALSNLGSTLVAQGSLAKAKPLLERSLAITEDINSLDHPDTANSLVDLANVLRVEKSFLKAESLYRRALIINEKTLGANNPQLTYGLTNLAILYSDQGAQSKAETLYLRSLALDQQIYGPDHYRVAIDIDNLAELYEMSGRQDKAAPLIHRSLAIELSLMQSELQLLNRSGRELYLGTLGQAFTGGSSYIASFSFAKRGEAGANLALFARLNRQGLLEEIEKRQAQLASLPGPQQQTAEQLRAVTQKLASLSLTPERRSQLKIQQETLERQLYRLLPELKPRIVEVAQVAAALPTGGALIEFQKYRPFDGKKSPDQRWGEPRYLALVLKPDAAITAVDLGPAAAIETLIQQALQASQERLADAQELWAEVSHKVMDPLATATQGVQNLFLSPDAELNRIPFAALPVSGGKQLLPEVFKLRLLTTGRELLDLQQPTAKARGAALVVANPSFDHHTSPSKSQASMAASDMSPQQRSADLVSLHFNPLPGTAKEGQAIAGLIKGRLLVQDQATAAAVQRQNAPQILHIASHAFYLADKGQSQSSTGLGRTVQGAAEGGRASSLQGENPLLRSGIALAGANSITTSDEDDGYLTALEVAQLDWKGTELVVISACESGTGEIKAGEGVYGLKRAIAVAGARSSLLSLWKVDDAATAAFMESYYRRLKAGEGKADALASTQRDFRNHVNAAWRHPYVWAAFQLSGDWRAVAW